MVVATSIVVSPPSMPQRVAVDPFSRSMRLCPTLLRAPECSSAALVAPGALAVKATTRQRPRHAVTCDRHARHTRVGEYTARSVVAETDAQPHDE